MSEEFTNNPEEMTPEEKLAKFKLDVSSDAGVVDEQSDQANEDMRFVNVPGGMWEGFLEDDFSDDRVKLEFDIVSKPLQTYLGEWSQNRIGVVYKPKGEKTNDDDADLVNGIYRADFRDNLGKSSTDLSVLEAATCGVGAFKLVTIFEDDTDPENDKQRIAWRPIFNAYNTVIWDQAAQRADKSDARWCTELKPFTKDSFEGAYPGKDPVSAYTPDTFNGTDINTRTPDFVYVATRYEAIRKKETVFVYNNLQTSEIEVYTKEDHALIEDELKADEFRTFVRERKVMRRSVEKTIFSGEDILEKTRRIVGQWIPIIPVYGFRAYVDGVEYFRGLIRKQKDANRLFNMQVSQLAENAAGGGQEKPIFAPEQMENKDIQAIWSDMTNKPYMLANPLYNQDGTILHAGPLGYTKAAQLDASTTALLGIVPAYIQDVNGSMPQEVSNPDASGKAIREMRKIINMITAALTANIEASVEWSGVVYEAMAAEAYTTQRILFTIGKDGTESKTQLSKTVLDAETGKMIESNTLKGKKFRAYADVGPQYETMREQTVEDLKGMLEALATTPGGQQYTPAIIAVLLDNITGVGLDPIKELNRRMMLEQGLVKPQNEEEEAFIAQLQQSQQQEDPQQKLLDAAANQQNAEARSLDASSIDKVASAKKKEAETVEIIADIKNNQTELGLKINKQISDERNQTLKTVESLPLN